MARGDYGRLYGHKWRQARKHFLADHPICHVCWAQGKLSKATVVDHIVAHQGDERLFWDEQNWAPMCRICHDHKSAAEERGKAFRAFNEDGEPVNPEGHWH